MKRIQIRFSVLKAVDWPALTLDARVACEAAPQRQHAVNLEFSLKPRKLFLIRKRLCESNGHFSCAG